MTDRKSLEQILRLRLVTNATECTNYVALGDALAKDLAKRFDVPLNEMKGLLALEATRLNDHMKAFCTEERTDKNETHG